MKYGLNRAVPMSILGFCLGALATVLLRTLQQIDPVWNAEIAIIAGMLVSAIFFVAYMGAFDPAMSAHGDEHHDDDHATDESHAVMHDERAAALVDAEAKPLPSTPRPKAAAAAVPPAEPLFVPTYSRTTFAAVIFGALTLLFGWLLFGAGLIAAVQSAFPTATWLNVLPVVQLDGLFGAIVTVLFLVHAALFVTALVLNRRYPLLKDAIAALWRGLGDRADGLNAWLRTRVSRQWQPRPGVSVANGLWNLIVTLVYFVVWLVGFLVLTVVLIVVVSAFGGVWLLSNVLGFAGGGSDVVYQLVMISLVLMLGIWAFVQYSGFNLRAAADPVAAREQIGYIPMELFGQQIVFTELSLLVIFLLVLFATLALIGGTLAFIVWFLNREVTTVKGAKTSMPNWTKAPLRFMGSVANWLLARLPEPPQPKRSAK